MSAVLFRGAVVRPDGLLEDGAVLCTGGRIAAVGPGAEVETPPGALEIDGAFVAPGFVDIHVHGGAGADFMDGTLDAVLTATRAHARHGTTTIFPTTTTGSPEQLEAMLAACASVPAGSGARIAGVHLYGPFFAADKLGCGMTDNPKSIENYTQHDCVQHMWAFMQKMGITRCHIAGQSNGAYTAARLALEHPDVCRSLIISDSATLGPAVGNIAERREQMYVNRPTDPREGLRFRWEALGYTKGDVTDDYLDAALFMNSQPKARKTEEDLKNGGSEASRKRFAVDKEETHRWIQEGRLTFPILITWGANDPSAILPIGQETFEMIRQTSDRVQMHVFNHVGHFHFREIPDEWNDVVMTFLAHCK